jgi:hypothetical protein
MNDSDDLDRALFALPLAEPPAGLRAAILRSTIFAPVEPASALAMGEIVAIGAALAVAAWVAMIAAFDPASVARVLSGLGNALRSPAAAQDLAWLAAGAAVAVVASVGQGVRFPRPARRNRP